MDPALAGAIGGGLVLLGMGLALGCFLFGRSTTGYERERLRSDVSLAKASLYAANTRALARAKGSASDLADAVVLASVSNLDELLQHFPGTNEADTPAEQPGDEALSDTSGDTGENA